MNRKIAVLFSTLLATHLAAADPVAPPPQAAAAGFRELGFDEEFGSPSDIGYGTPGHKWNAGLWWEPVAPSSAFRVQDGVLTITATASEKVELCTQYHDASGGTYFRGGYFEARMRCSDWSAFWLYCADRPRVYGNRVLRPNPLTWTSEIDIIETDPGSANTAFCTVHKNTSGDGGVPDHRSALPQRQRDLRSRFAGMDRGSQT
jgi:beta-glucanase (GH16 family)